MQNKILGSNMFAAVSVLGALSYAAEESTQIR